MASVKKMNPAFTAPFCSVYIVSDGSIGETVWPEMRHCIKCAAISKVSAIERRPARCSSVNGGCRLFDL